MVGILNGNTRKKERKLFNHNRRLERQGGQCLNMPAAFRLNDMDRHPELLLEERLRGLEDVLLADRVLH